VFVREIIDAEFTPQDAKVLHFMGIFCTRRQAQRFIVIDSFLTAAPTKRMIVEEFPGKGKIFFRRALRVGRLGRGRLEEAWDLAGLKAKAPPAHPVRTLRRRQIY
jgi:hypothetical protein